MVVSMTKKFSLLRPVKNTQLHIKKQIVIQQALLNHVQLLETQVHKVLMEHATNYAIINFAHMILVIAIVIVILIAKHALKTIIEMHV